MESLPNLQIRIKSPISQCSVLIPVKMPITQHCNCRWADLSPHSLFLKRYRLSEGGKSISFPLLFLLLNISVGTQRGALSYNQGHWQIVDLQSRTFANLSSSTKDHIYRALKSPGNGCPKISINKTKSHLGGAFAPLVCRQGPRILEVAWTCLCEARVGSVSMTLTASPLLCINTTIPFNSRLHFRLSDWLHQKNESEVEKQNPLTFNFNLVQGHHFTEWTTNIQVEEGMLCLATTFRPWPLWRGKSWTSDPLSSDLSFLICKKGRRVDLPHMGLWWGSVRSRVEALVTMTYDDVVMVIVNYCIIILTQSSVLFLLYPAGSET